MDIWATSYGPYVLPIKLGWDKTGYLRRSVVSVEIPFHVFGFRWRMWPIHQDVNNFCQQNHDIQKGYYQCRHEILILTFLKFIVKQFIINILFNVVGRLIVMWFEIEIRNFMRLFRDNGVIIISERKNRRTCWQLIIGSHIGRVWRILDKMGRRPLPATD